MQEAEVAKAKMNGRLACGRPMVVRFASEKCPANASSTLKTGCDSKNLSSASSTSGQLNRYAKIAAIKNKLKSLEEEGRGMKKPRLEESTSSHGANILTENSKIPTDSTGCLSSSSTL